METLRYTRSSTTWREMSKRRLLWRCSSVYGRRSWGKRQIDKLCILLKLRPFYVAEPTELDRHVSVRSMDISSSLLMHCVRSEPFLHAFRGAGGWNCLRRWGYTNCAIKDIQSSVDPFALCQRPCRYSLKITRCLQGSSPRNYKWLEDNQDKD